MLTVDLPDSFGLWVCAALAVGLGVSGIFGRNVTVSGCSYGSELAGGWGSLRL